MEKRTALVDVAPPDRARLLFSAMGTAAAEQQILPGGAAVHMSKDIPEAREACMAMNPEERPMSLTTPMPLSADDDSTLADNSAS